MSEHLLENGVNGVRGKGGLGRRRKLLGAGGAVHVARDDVVVGHDVVAVFSVVDDVRRP